MDNPLNQNLPHSLLPETKIYRYLTFEKFVSLVENQELYLTKLSEWLDPYENKALIKFSRDFDNKSKGVDDIWGRFLILRRDLNVSDINPFSTNRKIRFLFNSARNFYDHEIRDFHEFLSENEVKINKIIEQPEYKEILSMAKENKSFMRKHGDLIEKLRPIEAHYLILSELNLSSSWTIHDEKTGIESDGLWIAYSKGSGVRIQTSVRKLDELISKVFVKEDQKEYNTEKSIARVIYDDDFGSFLSNPIVHDENIPSRHKIFYLKRKPFEYEQEVRAFITLIKKKDKQEGIKFIDSSAVYARIPNLSDFVEEVVVDPRCHSKHAETIQQYCNSRNMKCFSSNLYTFDIDANPYTVDTNILAEFDLIIKKLENSKFNNKIGNPENG